MTEMGRRQAPPQRADPLAESLLHRHRSRHCFHSDVLYGPGQRFLVRRGTSGDWIPVHLPAVLWLNTLALVASSFTLERARRALSRLDLSGFRKLWAVTTGLGALF